MEELFKKKKKNEHYINHKKICVIIYFISYIATKKGFQGFIPRSSLGSLWFYPHYFL